MDSILAFPFDDTEYEAVALGAWFATRTRGVFSANDHLSIATNGDMSVTVGPGLGWLKMAEYWGVSVLVREGQVLTPEQSDGALTRIDPVCLRINKNLNKPELLLKTGEYAANPTIDDIPLPTQNLDFDEIYVGALRIRAGATEVLDTDIIDLRLDERFCGIMKDGVTGIPTQALYDMWRAWFDEFQNDTQAFFATYKQMAIDLYAQYAAEIAAHGNDAQAAYDAYIDRMTAYENSQKADWEAWVASLKDILDEETAGHLQLEIEELQQRVPTNAIGTVSTLAATPQIYPICALYKTSWAFGIGGAGVGPAGGTSVVAIDSGLEFDGAGNVTVTAPGEFQAFTDINQLSDTMYAFMVNDTTEMASLVLRIVKEA